MKQNNNLSWKSYLREKNFLIEFIITISLLIIVLISFSQFLNFVEARNGTQLNDPILKLFSPIDFTWIIFGIIYVSIISFFIFLIKYPKKLIFSFQCYTLLILIRIIAMYLVPFDAPKKIIPLIDPFVEIFGTGQVLTKDLFFSGHTATLFLFFLIIENKILKFIFLFLTIIVGVALILQHVHYSIDVFAAPFFAYAAYKIIVNSPLGRGTGV